MKLKNSLDNSEQHSNEKEYFDLLPASKDILQSNDPKSNNQNTNHAQIPIESLHTADENNDSEQSAFLGNISSFGGLSSLFCVPNYLTLLQ
jgi:hypothetical protein